MPIEKDRDYALAMLSVETACSLAGSMNLNPEALMNALAFHLVIAEATSELPPGPDTAKLFDLIAEKTRQFVQQEIKNLQVQSN